LADFVVILHLPVWGGLLEDLGGDPRTSTWDHPDIMISYDIMKYSNLVSVWWFFRILNIVLDFWSSWFQNHEDKLATPQKKISLPWQQATSLASPCHEGHIKWLVNNSEWITAEVSWATRFTRSLQDPKLLKLWARHGPIKLFWALYGLIMTGHSVTHGCDPPSMALGAAPGSHPPGNTVDVRNPAPPGMVESL
jgi:hypothetical protein